MSYKFFTMDVRALCANVTEQMKENHLKNGGVILHFNELSEAQKEYAKKTHNAYFTEDVIVNERYLQPFFFSVKEDFLKKCPSPESTELYDLINKFGMNEFIHNETGPAIINTIQDHKFYYMNGRMLDDETIKKIEHSKHFMDKFNKLIE